MAPECGFSKKVFSRRLEDLNLKHFYLSTFVYSDLTYLRCHLLIMILVTVGRVGSDYLNQSRFAPKPLENMRFFVVLVSLFAAVQAQFSFGAPASGSTIQAGKDVTVQIIVPIDTVSYILCLHVRFACLPTHLECGSRPSGSQPCNRHC